MLKHAWIHSFLTTVAVLAVVKLAKGGTLGTSVAGLANQIV